MQLADGVYALSQTVEHEEGPTTVHPAAVETERGVVLLDVGFRDQLDQLSGALENAGHDFEDVWAALITHQDGDHAGALADVVDRTDAVVMAHRECAPYLDGREDPIKGDGDRYPPVSVDVELVDGVRLSTAAGPMEVVFTPGHAPGHVSLYFPGEKLLIAGDALTAREGDVAPPSEEYTLDYEEATESVGRLSEYDVFRTLCYHGGFAEQGTGAIAKLWNELVA
ncbi:MBL fold metallo-hydrolase [Halobacteriales archaeon QS_1_68_20]|nr:MAG: MBL fold metallo-hydrolase [Halobacteriales archaeon QS_1_68_20]